LRRFFPVDQQHRNLETVERLQLGIGRDVDDLDCRYRCRRSCDALDDRFHVVAEVTAWARIEGERDHRRDERLGADPGLVFRAYVDRSDQIRHGADVGAAQVVADAVEQARPEARIGEIRGADLYGAGAGDNELEGVSRIGDATHPDDWNLHRL